MSRGGRGGFGAGRGGSSSLPPMGLTYADIASISQEPTALYPPMDPLPLLTSISEEESQTHQYQVGFGERLRKSSYYILENKKSTELPRYSDKYRVTAAAQPPLLRKDLNQEFFPSELWDAYFYPKKKRRERKAKKKVQLNLDEMEEEGEEGEKSDDASGGSQQEEADYDEEEEYGDDDYGTNYFDNGEADDVEDAGADDVGGEATYD